MWCVKAEAGEQFIKIAHMEEISCRQKSRCLWLKKGDRNTKFFHRMANAHRRGNQLGPILVDGVWLVKEEEIREGVANFYRGLFQEGGENGWRPRVDELAFDVLSKEDRKLLECPFFEDEVVVVLKDFEGIER